MKTFWHMFALAVAGSALGFAANALSPRPAPLGRPVVSTAEAGEGQCAGSGQVPPVRAGRIGVEEAKALCGSCSVAFVDARGAGAFEAGHVPEAIHLPPAGHPEEKAVVERLRGFPTVVVYDGENTCALADTVAERLSKAGLRDVRVLIGAWPAWLAAGGPGASGACSDCTSATGATP